MPMILGINMSRARSNGASRDFSIPLAEWLKTGPFRELFWDTLTSRNCLFDPVTTRSLLQGQNQGRSNGEYLLALVQFELWRKTYGTSL